MDSKVVVSPLDVSHSFPHTIFLVLCDLLCVQAPSVLFLPGQQLPLYSLGIQSALVVDVGHDETTVLPISS